MTNTEGAILIVEDDTVINELLATALGKAGFKTAQAFSGTEARLLLASSDAPYSLVLLDLMLPGLSGEEVLRFIRERMSLPVIVITAKDELNEKINVFELGADDYITKPFEIQEVIARINVQLRHAAHETESDRVTYRDMVLDKATREIAVAGRNVTGVTKQEFAILELLLRHPKQVYTKEEIFEYAWDEVYMGETKTLDVHISNIRKKLKEVTEDEYIETVWGIGYRLHE